MPLFDPVARQRSVDHDACRIVGAVALGHRPPADRRDALLHAPRRLALLVPDGLDDRHDVARRHAGHREVADDGVDASIETRPPHLPRFRTAPARLVHGDHRVGCLPERWTRRVAACHTRVPARFGDLPPFEGPGPRLGQTHRRVVPDAVVGAPAPDGEPLDPHLRAPRRDAQIQPVLVDELGWPLG